jgi:hypothetical protein
MSGAAEPDRPQPRRGRVLLGGEAPLEEGEPIAASLIAGALRGALAGVAGAVTGSLMLVVLLFLLMGNTSGQFRWPLLFPACAFGAALGAALAAADAVSRRVPSRHAVATRLLGGVLGPILGVGAAISALTILAWQPGWRTVVSMNDMIGLVLLSPFLLAFAGGQAVAGPPRPGAARGARLERGFRIASVPCLLLCVPPIFMAEARIWVGVIAILGAVVTWTLSHVIVFTLARPIYRIVRARLS